MGRATTQRFGATTVILVHGTLLGLTGCGGGGGGGNRGGGGNDVDTPPPTFSVGGTVAGLNGSGLVLRNNDGNDLAISANGQFTFSTALTGGSRFAVIVATQPGNPTQNCTVTNGSGNIGAANITTVQVNCANVPLTLTSSNPASGATGIERTTDIVLAFSAGLNVLTVSRDSVQLRSAAGFHDGTLSISGSQLGLALNDKLLPATTYTFGVSTEVRGIGGERLERDVETTFTTRDGEWGVPESIDNPNPDDALDAEVALNEQGDGMVVWLQSTATDTQIWASQYKDGDWQQARRVDTGTGDAFGAKVGVDQDGNAIAVWHQRGPAHIDVWAARFVAETGEWRDVAPISTNSTGDTGSQQIAIDAAGNAMVVWHERVGSDIRDIVAARYTIADGWQRAVRIETDPSTAFNPQIALDGAGNAIAVWQARDAETFVIKANHFQVSGESWGTTPVLLSAEGFHSSTPQIAADAAGNALVVWRQSSAPDVDLGAHIIAARYTSGERWGDPEPIETRDNDVALPEVVMDSLGNALAAWLEASPGTNRPRIVANRYTSGDGWGEAVLIGENDACSISEEIPRVVMDRAGNGQVLWSQDDSACPSMITNRYAAGSGWTGMSAIENDPAHDSEGPALAIRGDGDALAVWSQNDGGGAEVVGISFE